MDNFPSVLRTENNPWLHRFALLTAVAALALIGVGGLVTSHEAGLSVPDWPTSWGYNMFFFPVSKWLGPHAGGVFFEHSHRLVASGVGLLTTILAVWLWLRESRAWLRWLGVLAFAGVVFQGVLGGLRVILLEDQLGIFHAAIAQLFLVLVSAIALFTSRWWPRFALRARDLVVPPGLRRLCLVTTLVILSQLILGATMRHQHAGLSIPDFPLAYRRLWPDTSADAITRYNQRRMDVNTDKPVTAFEINLQMAHRLVALAILGLVFGAAWASRRRLGWTHPVTKLCTLWLALIGLQVGLGAWTIWSNKAADIATLHVLVGAVSLVMGSLASIVARRTDAAPVREAAHPAIESPGAFSPTPATGRLG